MTKEKLKKISNLIFGLSTVFAVMTLVIVGKDYLTMAGQEVCPISRHNALIYTALGLLLISIVVTSILDAKVKKMADEVKKEASIYDRTLETLKEESLEGDLLAGTEPDNEMTSAQDSHKVEDGN